MVDVEGHEGGRSGDIIAVGLVRADANVPDTGLRFRHDRCRILVLGRFKSPRHLEFRSTSSFLQLLLHPQVELQSQFA
jgi:hypothetical protein